MAVMFAEEGANLALCTSSNMAGLEATAGEVESAGAKVLTMKCDVTDKDSVADFVAKAHDKFGSLDVVVNNAVFRSEGDLLEEPEDVWQRNIDVNLNGPYYVCKNAVPHMVERGWGRIVNFSGIAPYLGSFPGKSTVKLGIVGFTRGLAKQYGEHNITANCIGPGHIEVERDAFQVKKGVFDQQPIRRSGQPDEVAGLAIYLASEYGGYVTGQCYLVNGGAYMQ
ncbi:MAG TPA: SDR family NAD(P)-dependent oxidoreductase, partial [Thermohalobaculum sp.]|nr:SDR family NAD(P)-dependent oxidoreductase [Thermohalobaculum sp.]